MANVRFYRLPALPVWDAEKYKGIFVHIEDSQGNGEFNPFADNKGSIEIKESGYKVWKYGSTRSEDEIIGLYWINDRGGASEVIQTFETNNSETITIKGRFTYMGDGYVCTGLWFGGSFGWELLTNDTDVNYINQLIDSKINTLDVNTIQTVTHTNSTTSGVSGEVFTFKGVKEVDGKIQDGGGTGTFIVGDGSLIISGKGATSAGNIPDAVTTDVFSANDTANNTITLGNEFVWDGTNKTLGLRVNTPVSATNYIVTKQDIASLSGAMHYKGGITAYPTPTTDTKAGDTYVVTTGFTNSGTTYEVGDMFVANADGTSATYTVVQTNMTLGTGQGQVAANSAALTSGNLVVASGTGIQTAAYNLNNASSRTLSVGNTATTTGDTNIIHETKATDTLTILGKDNVASLKINSTNDSIDVRGYNTGNDGTITLDLVWNTVLA